MKKPRKVPGLDVICICAACPYGPATGCAGGTVCPYIYLSPRGLLPGRIVIAADAVRTRWYKNRGEPMEPATPHCRLILNGQIPDERSI